MSPYQVLISAENRKQARNITDTLLKKKLVVGASILSTPSKFLWKGKVVNMKDYCYVQALTTASNKRKIISEAEKISKEEVPMIFFFNFESNKKYSEWLNKSLK